MTRRLFFLLVSFILLALGGCDPDKLNPLSLEVAIAAPDSVYVGETFEASAEAEGSTLVYEWSDLFDGTISSTSARSPSITICDNGDPLLQVRVHGAIGPGVPGEGIGTKRIHVFPPVSDTISDSDFAEDDWETVLDYDCDEPVPETYSYSASRVSEGGHSGAYRTLRESMLWEDNPGSLIMDFDHRYLAEAFDPGTEGPIEFVRVSFFAQSMGERFVRFRPVIRQDGRVFVPDGEAVGVDPQENRWVLVDLQELAASDFHEDCSRGGELDFSTDGSPLEFGVRMTHRTYDVTDEPESLVTNIDDFEVEIAAPWSVEECIADHDLGDQCPDDPDKTEPGVCGCGVADVDNDGDDIPDCLGDCSEVAGIWDMHVSNVRSTCPPEADWHSTLTIEQEGCTLGISGIKDDPRRIESTIVGNILIIGPETFDDDGGQTRTTFTLTVTSETTMTGTESWSWSQPGGTPCTGGTADVTVTKLE